MADNVTMVVKVNLECPSCYKKIKKVLAKFPEIRDQVYDVQKGTVTITVVCCNPEKIRDKLCCKGGKTIKGIEIKVPSKTNGPKKEGPDEKSNPKGADQKAQKSNKDDKTNGKEEKTPPQKEVPVHGYPLYYPMGVCCRPCYEGHGGGPCYCGHGRPVPCYDNYGYPRGWYLIRCDYFTEENAYACTIM